jgi:hypothetical protein
MDFDPVVGLMMQGGAGMNTLSLENFRPGHDVPSLIQNDQTALAMKMGLCKGDQDGWGHVRLMVAQVQAFSAQYVISMLLLRGSATGWLRG